LGLTRQQNHKGVLVGIWSGPVALWMLTPSQQFPYSFAAYFDVCLVLVWTIPFWVVYCWCFPKGRLCGTDGLIFLLVSECHCTRGRLCSTVVPLHYSLVFFLCFTSLAINIDDYSMEDRNTGNVCFTTT
jgi:hypothetical protein